MSKEALIFASIWHRNRFVISGKTLDDANDLFFGFRDFIPQYRNLILCGDVPKESRYLKGVKLIDTDDLPSLREAFIESIAEEDLGAPPVQIIFFNATAEVFGEVLQHIDRGWVATYEGNPLSYLKKSFEIWEEFSFKKAKLYTLDPLLADTALEEKLIEDTKNNSKGVRLFKFQMKQSQVYLAFQAIGDELEVKEKITQSYLSETLELREKELRKIIEIGKRERRLDLSNYIEQTPTELVKFLKEISAEKELSMAAIFRERNLVGYARYRNLSFPSSIFTRIEEFIEKLNKKNLNIGKRWYFRLASERKDIFIFNEDYLYCFVLEKGINFIAFKTKIEKLINKIVKKVY
ncbi:MAG: hypothetical protein JXB26_12820 [Candidatus Aminicenantes bacterium]|nr:hypothetical protein [Candidatus Aminicenantes bacterium]